MCIPFNHTHKCLPVRCSTECPLLTMSSCVGDTGPAGMKGSKGEGEVGMPGPPGQIGTK